MDLLYLLVKIISCLFFTVVSSVFNLLINPFNGFNDLYHLIDNTLEGLFKAEGLTVADYNRRYFNQEFGIIVPHPFAWEVFKGMLYLVDVERG